MRTLGADGWCDDFMGVSSLEASASNLPVNLSTPSHLLSILSAILALRQASGSADFSLTLPPDLDQILHAIRTELQSDSSG